MSVFFLIFLARRFLNPIVVGAVSGSISTDSMTAQVFTSYFVSFTTNSSVSSGSSPGVLVINYDIHEDMELPSAIKVNSFVNMYTLIINNSQ